MPHTFLDSASSYSGQVDQLVWIVTVLVGFWFLVAEGMLFWLMFRFRAREGVRSQYITGKEKHLKRWINWPHTLILVCDVVIVAAAIRVWVNVKQTHAAGRRDRAHHRRAVGVDVSARRRGRQARHARRHHAPPTHCTSR